MTCFENIKDRLKAKEYKMTPQRKVIIDVFTQNQQGHLSAEDVYQIVKKTHPELGLATVYRTLDLLAELDILKKINFGDGRLRYEFIQEDDHHHHHLICLSCGEVTEFGEDLLEGLETTITRSSGFKIVDHQLKFYGYCSKCQEKGNDK
ncbi:MAG: transcriptional repressor [Clostridia bacterium]|nr:transcriptional repressor [Clostridia bacterium]